MVKERERLLRELEQESRRSTLDGLHFFQAVAERSGMNLTDLQCLAILTSAGPVTAGQLAETMGLTTGAVTGVINRLERAGYVLREKDPADGRRVVVRPIGEKLERVGAGFFGSQQEALDALTSGYEERDLALLLDFVRRSNAITRDEIFRIRATSEGREGDAFSAPLGSVRSGRLVFANGASRLTLRAGSGMDELYRSSFEGPPPRVDVEDGTVTFRRPRQVRALRSAKALRGGHAEHRRPVADRGKGRASEVNAHLDGLDLSGLEIRGGASTFRVELPEPSGEVPVRISGGASEIIVRRPPGVAARVRLKGWASQLTFDDRTYGGVGNEPAAAKPGLRGCRRALQRRDLRQRERHHAYDLRARQMSLMRCTTLQDVETRKLIRRLPGKRRLDQCIDRHAPVRAGDERVRRRGQR